MYAIHYGTSYEFRPCDTERLTQEQLQELADKHGYMQYELRAAWLVIPGVGYGWKIED